jgi:hypothetical protein
MKLSKYSKSRMFSTFRDYNVPGEWSNVLFNYLVHGLDPGSFFTALFANDAMAAIGHSHTSNTIVSLKTVVSWLQEYMTEGEAFGSYQKVEAWLTMPSNQRRKVLETLRLIYTEQEEIMLILKDEELVEW